MTHSVDVEAETLYEAAALGIARLKKDGWTEGLGVGSRLEITVREPSTKHVISVQQLQRWIEWDCEESCGDLEEGEVEIGDAES